MGDLEWWLRDRLDNLVEGALGSVHVWVIRLAMIGVAFAVLVVLLWLASILT